MTFDLENKFNAAITAIDDLNSRDPNTGDDHGNPIPRELLYSRRLTVWIKKLTPDPSVELLLAARAQHICRWTSPRDKYPSGKSGYLKWRKDLQRYHADNLATVMTNADFDQPSIEIACDLILKKNFSKNPDGQTLEDAVCLVFLEFEFAKFAAKTDPDKIIDILQKTWKKMSPTAHQHALQLPLAQSESALVKKALNL